MKNVKFLAIIAMATMTIISCQKSEDLPEPDAPFTLTGYNHPSATKTSFGAPTASSIPFKWTTNDYVYANDVLSNPVQNDGEMAVFTFSQKPVGETVNVFYNLTGTSSTANVLKEQTQLGSTIDFWTKR